MAEQVRDTDSGTQNVSRLIRLKEVQHRVGLGRSTIYRWISEGHFPRPVQLGGHAVAWQESEVEEWIRRRIQDS